RLDGRRGRSASAEVRLPPCPTAGSLAPGSAAAVPPSRLARTTGGGWGRHPAPDGPLARGGRNPLGAPARGYAPERGAPPFQDRGTGSARGRRRPNDPAHLPGGRGEL